MRQHPSISVEICFVLNKHENRMVEMRCEINIEYFIVGHHPSKTLA